MKRFELRIYFHNKISESARITYTHPLYSEYEDKRKAIKEIKEIIDNSVQRIVLFDRIKKKEKELYISKKEKLLWQEKN